jgi:hypothetical protein
VEAAQLQAAGTSRAGTAATGSGQPEGMGGELRLLRTTSHAEAAGLHTWLPCGYHTVQDLAYSWYGYLRALQVGRVQLLSACCICRPCTTV